MLTNHIFQMRDERISIFPPLVVIRTFIIIYKQAILVKKSDMFIIIEYAR